MPPKKSPATKTAAKPATKTAGGAKSTGGAKGAGAAKGTGGAKAPPQAKPTEEPPKPKALPEIEMGVKSIPEFLLEDVGEVIKKSPRWPYIVNPSGVLSTFVKYRNINVLRVMDQHEMEAEMIRKGLLGALRYGKPFLIDMEDNDLFTPMTEFLDRVIPGLTDMLLTKKITEEENIDKLIRKNDDEDYQRSITYQTDNFRFAILTKKIEVSDEVKSKMFIVRAD
ncbi:uncharacterized protein LOC110441856 [Mizuhopecten yessoensis]|uniref:Uncharacterized protein n=1 Tax=Mizuhopecten yessoensis TaxID=6573 RepID=A0A210PII9_MIZYE|nr:uncharacterized protein LOC110441856 [Mizuhopecten yessoensis]XP_021340808.1 uncharacterized protein LOC110441856 [Mizuhopecten yessoensis]XP_021340809.1 uncharacterized protein LOC110441856 [Mizuhopecten yessoensis]OWF36299.1 hypothetical protein KP79_PYT19923 [Mizuhopecten yessoensis]